MGVTSPTNEDVSHFESQILINAPEKGSCKLENMHSQPPEDAAKLGLLDTLESHAEQESSIAPVLGLDQCDARKAELMKGQGAGTKVDMLSLSDEPELEAAYEARQHVLCQLREELDWLTKVSKMLDPNTYLAHISSFTSPGDPICTSPSSSLYLSEIILPASETSRMSLACLPAQPDKLQEVASRVADLRSDWQSRRGRVASLSEAASRLLRQMSSTSSGLLANKMPTAINHHLVRLCFSYFAFL
ncbi:unnamed protein product [Protopolystoma xenopodis]|uniref:Uncharacterized protein n=1 Tax=Protopolystoma xenopodis TaxID=117903 RepID=A0A448WUC3_9PLAT|nr:unnamed protein product [Protopolystoma xenopodis]